MPGKPLRILCLGDSLTSGWYQRGLLHPYSTEFKATLAQALPAYNVEVVTNGGPGDMVTYPRWTSRLQTELSRRTIDWVVMLGGANDIGGLSNADETFQALKKNWGVASSKGAKVLALTLLESNVKSAYLERDRDGLNHKILSHKAPNFYSFDLNPQIPYHSLTDEERSRLWDADGAHLSPTGYDKMGQIIAGALISILEEQGHIPVPHFSTEKVYMEEGGNPRNLSEGYIVVRRTDLD